MSAAIVIVMWALVTTNYTITTKAVKVIMIIHITRINKYVNNNSNNKKKK